MDERERVAAALRLLAAEVERGKYGLLETIGECDALGANLAEQLGDYVEART
jgi:hypothetical protein